MVLLKSPLINLNKWKKTWFNLTFKQKLYNMKIENKTVLEINSLENTNPLIGIGIDYLIIKKELKEEFEKHEFRFCVLPMLNHNGKILYS